MTKRKVAIASVLKPVDDPRMFMKMACSLADSGKYEVTVFGFPCSGAPRNPHVQPVPHNRFARTGIRRLWTPLAIGYQCLRLKPNLIIINTHELLLMASLLKVILRLRIIYDIRENYLMNLLHTRTFPKAVRQILAGWVRLKEKMFAPFFDHILLAEDTYHAELGFLKGRPVTVIENKAMPVASAKEAAGPHLRFVFTGTLAETTGVFKVTDFVHRLYQANRNVRLKIVGRCALAQDRKRLFRLAGVNPWLELQIQRDPVPHDQILRAISSADFGLICYPHYTHTRGRVPTKLFEYMAAGLPLLMEAGPAANDRAAGYEGLIVVEDFSALDPGEALRAIGRMRWRFLPPPGALWPPEGKRLCDLIGSLI